jgi:hypothetical protein
MIEAFAIVWLAATPVAADAVPSPSTCLQFEPTEEAITGILIQKTLPGPPNYEDLANGDRPDTSLFIRLATPICVAATPTSELNSQNIAGIGLVQLVVPAATFSRRNPIHAPHRPSARRRASHRIADERGAVAYVLGAAQKPDQADGRAVTYGA